MTHSTCHFTCVCRRCQTLVHGRPRHPHTDINTIRVINDKRTISAPNEAALVGSICHHLRTCNKSYNVNNVLVKISISSLYEVNKLVPDIYIITAIRVQRAINVPHSAAVVDFICQHLYWRRVLSSRAGATSTTQIIFNLSQNNF